MREEEISGALAALRLADTAPLELILPPFFHTNHVIRCNHFVYKRLDQTLNIVQLKYNPFDLEFKTQ